jgi:chorismate mutase/prephenate dehydratase
MTELDKYRQQIDQLDHKLLSIIRDRLEIVAKIADYKKQNGVEIFDPKREKLVLENISKLASQFGLPNEIVVHIYELILNESKKYQKHLIHNQQTIKIGIQGGVGSFNHQAISYYKEQKPEYQTATIEYLYTVENVFAALESGEIDYGQFAAYNSLGGMVGETLAQIGQHHFVIEDSYQIQIAHFLMIHPEANLDQIDTVMGHEQVLKQCKATLQADYGNLKQVAGYAEFTDNTSIAEGVMSGKLPKTTACLAGVQLAKAFGLKVVAENLQDHDQNYTTFLLVRK